MRPFMATITTYWCNSACTIPARIRQLRDEILCAAAPPSMSFVMIPGRRALCDPGIAHQRQYSSWLDKAHRNVLTQTLGSTLFYFRHVHRLMDHYRLPWVIPSAADIVWYVVSFPPHSYIILYCSLLPSDVYNGGACHCSRSINLSVLTLNNTWCTRHAIFVESWLRTVIENLSNNFVVTSEGAFCLVLFQGLVVSFKWQSNDRL